VSCTILHRTEQYFPPWHGIPAKPADEGDLKELRARLRLAQTGLNRSPTMSSAFHDMLVPPRNFTLLYVLIFVIY